MRKETFLKYKAIIILLSLFCSRENLQAQFNGSPSDPTVISIPTPQAASLGKFGLVPVNLYNGLFDLSIPIYHLPVKGHSIDIKLAYQSGGIKPTEKGGVVGVGWSLMATGTITRIQNGTLDEHYNQSYSDPYLGYYWNQSQLNKTNWDNPDTIINFLKSITCPSTCNLPQWHDWAPDEFQFNFFGYSGSFWLDHTGAWVIRENNGEKLKLVVDFGYYSYKYPTASDSVRLNYTFKKFTITDGNGNVFVFGGNSNSIEFNRNAFPNTNGLPNAQATSWCLTQIITSKGEKIDFTYQRLAPSATVYRSTDCYKATLGSNIYSEYNLEALTGVAHDPLYLQQINYRNLSIQFSYSPQNITYYPPTALKYDASTGVAGTDIYNIIHSQPTKYPNTEIKSDAANPKDYQLDLIQIYYGAYSRRFAFEYDTTEANRLFLKYVKEGPLNRQLVYQFDYNGTWFSDTCDQYRKFVDGILTTKVDHWGYYTGKLPFQTDSLPKIYPPYYEITGSGGPGYYFPHNSFINYYYNSRQPIFDSTKIGSLAKVTYPTGGYTEFIYEANDYSSQIDLNNNTAKFLGNNFTTGGLRIKETRSYASATSVPVVKKYKYVNDNGYSSGVLNSAGILYKDSLVATTTDGKLFTYQYFYDNNQLPLQNTNGNHVTYSRVDEINPDKGVTVYRYTNHDNGHYDLLPTSFITSTADAQYYRAINSKNFQRGKLLTQEAYDSTGILLSKDTMVYINDDFKTANYVGVRAYDMKAKDIKMTNFTKRSGIFNAIFPTAYIWAPNISPYVHYVHDYPIVQKTTTTFSGSNSISTTETFAYDSINNRISKDSLKNLSDGSIKIDTYAYPNDLSSGNSFYTGMITDNVINPVIQKTTTDQSNKVLSVLKDSLTKIGLPLQNLYLLYQRKIYEVPSDVTKMTILKYDSVGNPLWTIGADGVPVCYQWDYSFQYPTVVVKNANDSNYAYTSFEAEGTGHWSVPDGLRDVTNNFTGLQSYDLTSSKTISATVASGKQLIVSYWATNSNVIVKSNGIAVAASLTGPIKNGWTYYQHVLPSTTTSVSVTASANVTIDELRLYPADAQMTTYTYDPISGITSMCSPNNVVTYYEYDAFGRLVLVRDFDKNIIRTLDYKYFGQ